MQFKDVNPGQKVYILDQSNVTVAEAQVINRGFPYAPKTNNWSPSSDQSRVVDVTLEVEGKQATYAIPENSSITYAGDLTLTTDRNLLGQAIESLTNSLDKVIRDIPKYKANYEKAKKLRMDFDPSFKKDQEYENRFTKIEAQNNKIEDLLNKVLKKLDD